MDVVVASEADSKEVAFVMSLGLDSSRNDVVSSEGFPLSTVLTLSFA